MWWRKRGPWNFLQIQVRKGRSSRCQGGRAGKGKRWSSRRLESVGQEGAVGDSGRGTAGTAGERQGWALGVRL